MLTEPLTLQDVNLGTYQFRKGERCQFMNAETLCLSDILKLLDFRTVTNADKMIRIPNTLQVGRVTSLLAYPEGRLTLTC